MALCGLVYGFEDRVGETDTVKSKTRSLLRRGRGECVLEENPNLPLYGDL